MASSNYPHQWLVWVKHTVDPNDGCSVSYFVPFTEIWYYNPSKVLIYCYHDVWPAQFLMDFGPSGASTGSSSISFTIGAASAYVTFSAPIGYQFTYFCYTDTPTGKAWWNWGSTWYPAWGVSWNFEPAVELGLDPSAIGGDFPLIFTVEIEGRIVKATPTGGLLLEGSGGRSDTFAAFPTYVETP